MDELNKEEKFNIQKLIYKKITTELEKATKILVWNLNRLYPGHFKYIIDESNVYVSNFQITEYGLIVSYKEDNLFRTSFYDGEKFHITEYSPYDRQFKFSNQMIKIMQDMGIGIRSIPYLYKMKMKSVSGIWDKWTIIEDERKFNIKDNWPIIEKYLLNQSSNNGLIMETGAYYPI